VPGDLDGYCSLVADKGQGRMQRGALGQDDAAQACRLRARMLSKRRLT